MRLAHLTLTFKLQGPRHVGKLWASTQWSATDALQIAHKNVLFLVASLTFNRMIFIELLIGRKIALLEEAHWNCDRQDNCRIE